MMKYLISNSNNTDSNVINANINIVTMEYLVAYIQFAFWDIAKDYALSPDNIVLVLSNLYKAEKEDIHGEEKYYIIDIKDNWERYCSIATIIQSIELFEDKRLKSLLESIYKTKIHR